MKALALALLGIGMLAGPATAPASAKVHYPQNNLAADNSNKEESEDDGISAKPTKVGEALKKCGYLTDVRPRAAEVYFVFHARRDNGEGGILTINKVYKKMLHDNSAEVVMICEDQDVSDIKEWVKKEKVLFSIIPYNKVSQELPFPYKRNNTDLLPMLVVMDADGKKIDQASGSEAIAMIGKWKKIMRHYKVKKARAGRI